MLPQSEKRPHGALDFRHQPPDHPAAAVPLVRHHGAELDKPLFLAVEHKVRPVHRDVRRDCAVHNDRIGHVVVAPEAVLIPVLKCEAERPLRQRVKAAPQRIVRTVPLYNPLHMHASFFLHYSGKRTVCKEKTAGVSAGETSAAKILFPKTAILKTPF